MNNQSGSFLQLIIVLLFFLLSLNCISQTDNICKEIEEANFKRSQTCSYQKQVEEPFDTFTTREILLKKLNAKKIVSYEIDSVLIMVDYKYFISSYSYTWKYYKKGRFNKRKAPKDCVYATWARRSFVIDSVYKILKSSTADTIFLTHCPFFRANLNCLVPLNNAIENFGCVIKDLQGNEYKKIIVIEGALKIGSRSIWGGLRYYLPNKSRSFFTVMKWIT